MADIEFHLFRIKLIKPQQIPLFGDNLTRKEILQKALFESPSKEIRQSHFWHIGNLRRISNEWFYFAVGRTTKTTLEQYDPNTKMFKDEELSRSPYTHVYLNTELGFLSLAKKPKLAPTTTGISRKLKKLIESANIIRKNELEVDIDMIPDPQAFIDSLSEAYSIKIYTAIVGRPNPIDADYIFQKSIERILVEVNGDKMEAKMKGEDLDADNLIEITRSIAATGNEAKATIVPQLGHRSITKRLSGNPTIFKVAEEDLSDERVAGLTEEKYEYVRGYSDEH
jgi:hypothetical protein